MDNEFYMRKAIEQAKIALEKDEVPVGAVIVCNNQIIARAHNLTQTLNDVTAHAEMQAFTSATGFLGGKYLQGCTLFVTLEPCVMCAGAAYWTQIDNIVYGAKDEKRGFGTVGKNLLHPKTKVTGGVLENECAVLLKEFFAGKRK
ncbi:MAG: nucleoside deaminase [Bacteroidales bacterium]|nr:nucleoside deaminase [Bacteroidales bacterium]